VYFGGSTDSIPHLGVYVGYGLMIDTPDTGAVIQFDQVDRDDLLGAVVPRNDDAAPRHGAPGVSTPQRRVLHEVAPKPGHHSTRSRRLDLDHHRLVRQAIHLEQ
jgi:hypothetical protein